MGDAGNRQNRLPGNWNGPAIAARDETGALKSEMSPFLIILNGDKYPQFGPCLSGLFGAAISSHSQNIGFASRSKNATWSRSFYVKG